MSMSRVGPLLVLLVAGACAQTPAQTTAAVTAPNSHGKAPAIPLDVNPVEADPIETEHVATFRSGRTPVAAHALALLDMAEIGVDARDEGEALALFTSPDDVASARSLLFLFDAAIWIEDAAAPLPDGELLVFPDAATPAVRHGTGPATESVLSHPSEDDLATVRAYRALARAGFHPVGMSNAGYAGYSAPADIAPAIRNALRNVRGARRSEPREALEFGEFRVEGAADVPESNRVADADTVVARMLYGDGDGLRSAATALEVVDIPAAGAYHSRRSHMGVAELIVPARYAARARRLLGLLPHARPMRSGATIGRDTILVEPDPPLDHLAPGTVTQVVRMRDPDEDAYQQAIAVLRRERIEFIGAHSNMGGTLCVPRAKAEAASAALREAKLPIDVLPRQR